MKDQFNGNAKKRRLLPHLTGHEVYKMVKDVHVLLGKQKMTSKNTKEDDIWKKRSIFWELPYWKNLDVHYSIDVMHIEKKVCESLLRTWLNTNEKTRDHGHARVDLKKMGIRPKLCLDDSVKRMKLSTSWITLSKHEKEFCRFLKNVKLAPGVKSYNYHVLRTKMIAVGIRNILPVSVREAIMNFCFFFSAIGQKVLSEEALESLEKGTLKLYAS
jgi:hypothetical protein